MAKKKRVEDKQQKSLTSFMDKTKPKKLAARKKPVKTKPTEKVEEKPEKIKDATITHRKIPDELFFKGNDVPFGLKADNFDEEK